MRSMVEGFYGLGKAPPPPFGRSPSPANAGPLRKWPDQEDPLPSGERAG